MELKSKLFIVTPEEMERIIDAARQQMTMQIL